MRRQFAVHATHEAAERVSNIGHVIAGWQTTSAWRRRYENSLLVGSYSFPDEGSVVDDLALREELGWQVLFDSLTGGTGDLRARGADTRLSATLATIAQRWGVRLVYGRRSLGGAASSPVLIASPEGVRRDRLELYRGAVQRVYGIDLAAYDTYPAVTEPPDRRLARTLDPAGANQGLYPLQPVRLVTTADGLPWPGGAGWAGEGAVLPRVRSMLDFSGHLANPFLLELQYHTFTAPALWAATKAILSAWAERDGSDFSPRRVALFAHDWMGVPLFWAAGAAGDRLGRSVYVAHEMRLFRLLADASLFDRERLLRPALNPEGLDVSLYPLVREALASGASLNDLFPGCDGFRDIYYHRLNRQARHFERVVAVGPWVADELQLGLRPDRDVRPPVVPVGLAPGSPGIDEIEDRRQRLAAVVERYGEFSPDLIMTVLARPSVHKGPWRVLGLLNRLAERLAARNRWRLACFWMAAPRPRPTRAEIERWAGGYGWPLDHLPAPEGDLRGDETMLWANINEFNERFRRAARVFYINQYGWNAGELGALWPGEATWRDFRLGTDLEVDLPVYEPFGYAALEPYNAGAVCVLSDASGAVRHLEAQGLGDTIVVGRFTEHDLAPTEIDRRTRGRIEAAVYDQIINEVFAQLGIHPEADRRTLRAARLRRASAALRGLGWETAVTDHLWPAVEPERPLRTRLGELAGLRRGEGD